MTAHLFAPMRPSGCHCRGMSWSGISAGVSACAAAHLPPIDLVLLAIQVLRHLCQRACQLGRARKSGGCAHEIVIRHISRSVCGRSKPI